MGENELGHKSCSEHIPIELWCRRSRKRNILSDCWWVKGFRMVELDNAKVPLLPTCSQGIFASCKKKKLLGKKKDYSVLRHF